MNETTVKPNNKKRVLAAAMVLAMFCLVALAAGHLYTAWLARPQDVVVPTEVYTAAAEANPLGQPAAAVPPSTGREAAEQVQPDGPAQGAPQKPVQEDAPAAAGLTQNGVQLTLYNNQTTQNDRFSVTDMLPGDSVSQYFCIRAYHNKDVPLYFTVENLEATNRLQDVLKLRVTRLSDGAVLCDAPVSGIVGKAFSQFLTANGAGMSDAWYSITAYLDTDTGNEYQQARLEADFKWYCEGEEGGADSGLSGIPQTGGLFPFWLVLGGVGIALILLALLWGRREKKREELADENISNQQTAVPPVTRRTLWKRLIAIFALGAMLVATSFALMIVSVAVPDNTFETAKVGLDLNDGAPVFDGVDLLLEPGRTLLRDFNVTNESTVDVYCRLYLQNLEGPLSGMVVFSLYDGEELLFSANAVNFDRSAPFTLQQPLSPGESKTLTLAVEMDKNAGNSGQDTYLTFDLSADAVQARNNPDKVFS